MESIIANIQFSLGIMGLFLWVGIGFRIGWLIVDFINKKMGD